MMSTPTISSAPRPSSTSPTIPLPAPSPDRHRYPTTTTPHPDPGPHPPPGEALSHNHPLCRYPQSSPPSSPMSSLLCPSHPPPLIIPSNRRHKDLSNTQWCMQHDAALGPIRTAILILRWLLLPNRVLLHQRTLTNLLYRPPFLPPRLS